MNKNITKKTIGELVNIFNYIRVPLSSVQRKDLDKIYPYYGAQGIVDYIDKYLFDGEYILVAEDGENLRSNNQNICNLINDKFWVNNHAHILQANDANSTKYLFYNFNRIKFEPYVTGSAQPKLNKENLLNIVTYVHDLKDQKKIAAVLSALDDKIELNNKINTELEQMAKTLYDYWFVQFDFPFDFAQGKPNEEGKPNENGTEAERSRGYKSSGGEMVYNAVLKREIPKGWEVKSLFETFSVQYGFPFSTDDFNEDKIGKPVIRIRDILQNSISTYSSQDNVDEKYKLLEGDLLVGMDGNFHLNFWTKSNCYLNQRVVRIREKDNILSNFIALFQIEPFIKLREKSVSRTTVGHLSDKDLKSINILLPSKELRKKCEIFDTFLFKIVSNKKQNQELASLRDWLLPMLMNGQVRVGEN